MNNSGSSFDFKNYDDRASLTTLSSVLYYVVPASDSGKIPYGFTYVDTIDIGSAGTDSVLEALREELGTEDLTVDQISMVTGSTSQAYKVYRNDYALPLAYTYEESIGDSDWEDLNAVQMQEAMLSAVVVQEGAADSELDPEEDLAARSVDYSITCNSSYVTQDGNSFIVTKSGASVTLTFEGLPESENYLIINGLDYDDTETWELYHGDESVDPLNLYTETTWDLLDHEDQESIRRNHIYYSPATTATIKVADSGGSSKTLTYYTPYYSFYSGREDFAVCLNYTEEAVTSITLTFSNIGIYTFDELLVVCEPMEDYAGQVNALKEDTLDELTMETDKIKGTISLEENKWLCFSIPYSIGWKAYVDGEEVELYQANIQYMALHLSAGEHEVKLIYQTPYLRIGIVISGIGAVLAAVVALFRRRRRQIRGGEAELSRETLPEP